LERLKTTNADQPLWKAAQSSSSLATEAATALLVGPPIVFATTSSRSTTERRLFSNLFLQGSAFANVLRMFLWLVPLPELSILCLDGSSLFLSDNFNKKTSATWPSVVTLSVLQALAWGKVQQAQALLFGQVALTGQQRQQQQALQSYRYDKNDVLIGQRNQRAMDVLQQKLKMMSAFDGARKKQFAILYGCQHCPGLHQDLLDLGFSPVSTEWRTAYSVAIPAAQTSSIPLTIPLLAFLYLVVGGYDWIGTVESILHDSRANDPAGASIDALTYLIRHVMLYVGLSKFVVEWKEPPLE
jgi:hypothetical protein